MSGDSGEDSEVDASNSLEDNVNEEEIELRKADDLHTSYAAGFAFSIQDDDVVLDFWEPDATFYTDESNTVHRGERNPVTTTRVFMTQQRLVGLYQSLRQFIEGNVDDENEGYEEDDEMARDVESGKGTSSNDDDETGSQ